MTSQRFSAVRAIDRLMFGIYLAVFVTVIALFLPRPIWAGEGVAPTPAHGGALGTVVPPAIPKRPEDAESKAPTNAKPKLINPVAEDIEAAIRDLNIAVRGQASNGARGEVDETAPAAPATGSRELASPEPPTEQTSPR